MARREEIFIDINVDTEDFKNLKRINNDLENTRAELRGTNKELKFWRQQLDASGGANKRAAAEVERLNLLQTKQKTTVRQLSSAFREASNDVAGLTAAGTRFRDKIAGSFTTALRGLAIQLAATFAVGTVVRFGNESVKAFQESEKAIAKVRQAINSTEGAAGRSLDQLIRRATQLQQDTLFGDEEILNDATAQLLTFTNIANEEFDRTQEVALDLATVLDGDLKSASIQLGKALNDPVSNLSALSRSGIQFSDAQEDVIKNLAQTNRLAEAQGVILDELERQYGGQARAAALADGGITQLRNAFGDFQEVLGGRLLDSAGDFLDNVRGIVEEITRWIDTPLSEELEEERKALNVLTFQIGATNEGSEERIRLIEQLKRENPGLLEGIDAEKVSNEQLTKAVQQLNKELVNRIILQRFQERINEQAERTADQQERAIESQNEAIREALELAEDYGIEVDKLDYSTPLEGARQIIGLLRQISAETALTPFDRATLNRNISALGRTIRSAQVSQNFLNSATEFGNKLQKEKQELIKQLGITQKTQSDIEDDSSKKEVFNLEVERDKLEALKRTREQLIEQRSTLQASDLEGIGILDKEISAIDRQIQSIIGVTKVVRELTDARNESTRVATAPLDEQEPLGEGQTIDENPFIQAALEEESLAVREGLLRAFLDNRIQDWTDFYLIRNQLQQEYGDLELEAFENLQNAKLNAAQGFFAALRGLIGDNQAAATAFLAIEKGLAAAQVIVNLQAERSKYFNAYAGVPGGPAIAASLATAASLRAATALATILAQTIAQSSRGFAEGGYTGGQRKTAPAGVVHEGEWVAPKWMVDSPKYSKVIQALEAGRRGLPGFLEGGMVNQNSITNLISPSNNITVRSQPVAFLDDLDEAIADRAEAIQFSEG